MSRGLRAVAWIVIPAVTAGLLMSRDRSTLDRGNRLFRDGRPAQAAEIYRALDGAEEPSGIVTAYNLGTALREAGDPEAGDSGAVALLEESLARGRERAAEGEVDARDSVALQRAHYNLARNYLEAAGGTSRLDSTFLFLSAAVRHNRQALQRNPTDEDARWNLAVAQRSLDSVRAQVALVDDRDLEEVEALDGIEFDSGVLTRAESSEPNALPPPEGTRPDPDQNPPEDPSRAQAAIQGAREALEGQDPGLIDRARAAETLEGFSDDPELVVRGILWVQRPDVVWWDQTPYPGGDW